jgi:hypothetical protein
MKVATHVRAIQQKRQQHQAHTKKMLEESFTQKCEKAKTHLTKRRETVRRHNEKVRLQRIWSKWNFLEVQSAKRVMLERLKQKHQRAEACLAQRSEKASYHNQQVAQLCVLKTQLASERRMLLAAKKHKCFSQHLQRSSDRVAACMEKARQRNEKVAERTLGIRQCQQKQAQIMALKTNQRCQKAEAQLVQRQQAAHRYNEKVAQRVLSLRQQQEKRLQSMKARWEQKKLRVSHFSQTREKQTSAVWEIPVDTPGHSGWTIVNLALERLAKYGEHCETKQNRLEAYAQRCAKSEELLKNRKEKAGQYNEKVSERVRDIQELRKATAQTKRMQLKSIIITKCGKAEAQLTQRREKARQHNQKVAERVQGMWQNRGCHNVTSSMCVSPSSTVAHENALIDPNVIHPGQGCMSLMASPFSLLTEFASTYLINSPVDCVLHPFGQCQGHSASSLIRTSHDLVNRKDSARGTVPPLTTL